MEAERDEGFPLTVDLLPVVRRKNLPLPITFGEPHSATVPLDAALDALQALGIPLHIDNLIEVVQATSGLGDVRRSALMTALRQTPGVIESTVRGVFAFHGGRPLPNEPTYKVTTPRRADSGSALSMMLDEIGPANLTAEDEVQLSRRIELRSVCSALGLAQGNAARVLRAELSSLSAIREAVARYTGLPDDLTPDEQLLSPKFRFMVDVAPPPQLLTGLSDKLELGLEPVTALLKQLSAVSEIHLRTRSHRNPSSVLNEIEKLGREATERMVESNMRLVVWYARRYRSSGLPWEDLLQEGTVGLLRAVQKFDYRMGNKFSTYAVWWIRQAISRAVFNDARLIRVPVHAWDGQSYSHELTGVVRDPVSMDVLEASLPLGIESALSATDSIDSDDWSVQEDIEQALAMLTVREGDIIRRRFGLDGQGGATLEEIGREYNVTRERIRQIEAKALRKLQKEGPMRYLAPYGPDGSGSKSGSFNTRRHLVQDESKSPADSTMLIHGAVRALAQVRNSK